MSGSLKMVQRDVRRQVIELRPRPRIVLRAHDHRDRRRIEMEQRVDGARARDDRHGAAGLQQLDVLHPHIAHAEVGRDRPRIFKRVDRVNARPAHDMECPGEFVLMDGRRAIHPKQELDVKSRIAVSHEFRLAEARVGLERLRVIEHSRDLRV